MTACGRPEAGNATGMLSGELICVYRMTSSYKTSPRQGPRRKSSNDSSGFSPPYQNFPSSWMEPFTGFCFCIFFILKQRTSSQRNNFCRSTVLVMSVELQQGWCWSSCLIARRFSGVRPWVAQLWEAFGLLWSQPVSSESTEKGLKNKKNPCKCCSHFCTEDFKMETHFMEFFTHILPLPQISMFPFLLFSLILTYFNWVKWNEK